MRQRIRGPAQALSLVMLFLLNPTALWAGISLDQHGKAATALVTPVTLGNVTGDLITCEVAFDGAGGNVFSSVSDPVNGIYSVGVAMEKNTNADEWFGIYYFQNAAAGSYVVSLNLTASAEYTGISCQAWKNVAITSALDTAFTQYQYVASTANATTGSNKTPSANHELILAAAGMDADTTLTAGTGYTLIDTQGGVSNLFPEYWIQTAATATNGAFVSASDNWTDQMVAFAPASQSTPITLDNHSSNDSGSYIYAAAAVTLSNVSAGDLITCEVTFAGGGVLYSVSDPVNGAYSAGAAAEENSGCGQEGAIYYFQNAAAGSYSVSLNLTDSISSAGISCQAWKNAATSSALDTPLTQYQYLASATNPNTGSNVTPSGNNELIIAAATVCAVTPTAGSGYTPIDSDTDLTFYPEYWIQTAATATNGAFTAASDSWLDQMAAFIPASQSTPMTLDTHGESDDAIPPMVFSVPLYNVTAGDLITCEVTFDGGNGNVLSSVSDPVNGTYSTGVAMEKNTAADQYNGIYYFQNAAAGSYLVNLNLTMAALGTGISCQAWKGVVTASALDASFTQNRYSSGANATTGSAKTPSSGNELVIAAAGFDSDTTATAGTSYTLVDAQGAATRLFPEYWIQTTATATNGPFTSASDHWTDQMVAFKSASPLNPPHVSIF